MTLLRAQVNKNADWWEIRLLDLDIAADGATEDDMLRELEHAMTAEYHLALEGGKTPFVSLLCAVPTERQQVWQENDKGFRMLNLPTEVRRALSAVLHNPTLSQFQVRIAA